MDPTCWPRSCARSWRATITLLVRIGEADHPLWRLRTPELDEAPLADRVEWATFSILTTAGRLDEAAFLERIYVLFPGLDAPDEELVRASLAAYASVGRRGCCAARSWRYARRTTPGSSAPWSTTAIGSACGAWVGRRVRSPVCRHDPPRALRDDERRAYLPLIVRASAETLAAIDAIWYVRGRMAFMFDVEWTAMLGEPILRRGVQIEPTDQQARFSSSPRSGPSSSGSSSIDRRGSGPRSSDRTGTSSSGSTSRASPRAMAPASTGSSRCWGSPR